MNFFACGSSTPPLPPSTFSFRSSEAMAEQKDKGKGVMKDSPPTRNMAWGCHLQTDNVGVSQNEPKTPLSLSTSESKTPLPFPTSDLLCNEVLEESPLPENMPVNMDWGFNVPQPNVQFPQYDDVTPGAWFKKAKHYFKAKAGTEAANVDPTCLEKTHVLLAVTEAVTARLFPIICREISKFASVRAIASDRSLLYMGQTEFPTNVPLYTDNNVFKELCQWADILLIAPLSAESLAKIALGHCDNLLTYTIRAWEDRKPIYAAPSMDKAVWQHHITERQLKIIGDELGITLIPPMPSGRSSRNYGNGEMAEVSVIYTTILFFVYGIPLRVTGCIE